MYVVPAFVGLGAPYWDAYARGTITGVTRGTTKEHFIRAALESIAYQVYDVTSAMERDCGVKVTRLAADGGAATNNFLMQFMADISGAEVVRPETVETTALGAAYLAGLAVGVCDEVSIRRSGRGDMVFRPQLDAAKRKSLLDGWHDAVRRAQR